MPNELSNAAKDCYGRRELKSSRTPPYGNCDEVRRSTDGLAA